MVMGHRLVTERCIASSVGISQEKMHFILTEDLNRRKLPARWVTGLLTVDQRHTRQNMSLANMNLFETDPEKFLLSCVTMDERLVQHFIPESKQQSKQWNHSSSTCIIRQSLVRQLVSFLEAYGTLIVDYFQKDTT